MQKSWQSSSARRSPTLGDFEIWSEKQSPEQIPDAEEEEDNDRDHGGDDAHHRK